LTKNSDWLDQRLLELPSKTESTQLADERDLPSTSSGRPLVYFMNVVSDQNGGKQRTFVTITVLMNWHMQLK
jgi:hypothetical protein